MNSPQPAFQDQQLEQIFLDLESGNVAAASEAATRLVAERPYDHRVLQLAASVALAEGRFSDCEKLIKRALESAPTPREQALLWSLYGRLTQTIGNSDYTEEHFRRAALSDPATVEHAIQFAETLAERGKLEPAIDVLRGAITRHPRDPQPCVTLGNVLAKANRPRDALAIYDMALQRDPNSAEAHFNAGVVLTMLGNLDGARTAIQNALKIDPTMSAYYQLASLGALKVDDPAMAGLESLLQDGSASVERRIDAGFALAKAYDDAGDAARAFPPLTQANAMKRATLDYDVHADELRAGKIVTLFTGDFFQRFAGTSASKLAPIFVLGMPRSGTTLVEQMLAGHTQVQAGGEQDAMVRVARRIGETWGSRGEASPGSEEQVRSDILQAAAEYAQATAALQGRKPYFTDKLPGNFMFIGLIHLMYPEARIIHCRRDPVDTCLSCFQRLFSSEVPYSYDLRELGLYYRSYQRLMDHWHSVLPPGRILDVDYESLVAEPEAGLREMLEFCGLEYQAACLDFQDVKRSVTTASAVQVRKPLYRTSVHRWKKYGADLNPLLDALGKQPPQA